MGDEVLQEVVISNFRTLEKFSVPINTIVDLSESVIGKHAGFFSKERVAHISTSKFQDDARSLR